jgi:hypothetical protein
MTKTDLPTKNDYQHAMDELKKLNEDLFYDDFKMKIQRLETRIEQLVDNSSIDFKNETENIINKTNTLLHQIDIQQIEVRDLLEKHQDAILQKNQEFLETERKQNLLVFEKLQKSINEFTKLTGELQEKIERNNKQLVDRAIEAVSPVSQHITEFVDKLSLSDEKNREFLEQNRAYVTLTKTQMTEIEQQLTMNTEALQQMDERIEKLLNSYETKLQIHEQGLKNILVVREEALINKLANQYNNWILKQYENDELNKGEILQWHEKVAVFLKDQKKQNEEILDSISRNMSKKEDLEDIEKKNTLKMNILLAVVAIETIFIGVQFFI